MNILFVSAKSGWGGIMSWMIHSAEGLEKKGHNVWIVSNPKSRLNKVNYPHLKIIEKELGFNYSPITVYFLYRFIMKNKIDLVLSNIKKEVIVSGLASRLAGVPNVRRIGSAYDINSKIKKIQSLLVKHSIIPCEYIFKEASKREHWLIKKEFTVIYNGRDVKTFSSQEIDQIRNSWGVGKNDLVIGATVKLSKSKNISGLIESFASINEKYPNTKLVVTGFGEEQESLIDLVRKLKIVDNVVFNEFSFGPQLMASCYDIAVLNSLIEGFPNSLVEYMSVGTPSISTNVGGVSELVQNNVNGLLINSGDNNDLIEKLSILIEDKELRIKIGENGKETIKKGFNFSQMIDNIEKLFLTMIQNV